MSAKKNESPVTVEVAEEPKAKDPNTVELETPIQRGNTQITEVTLRKPMSGELRGASLSDLLHMDVLSLRTVLPRITTPALTDVEIGRMDPADLVSMGTKVAGFLLPKAAKEASLTA